MSPDDFRANPEAKSGSGVALCADKRLEECLSNLGDDPRACVCHGQTDAGTRPISVFARVRNPDLEPASLTRCVQRVSDQVQNHLAKLAGHSNNWRTFPKIFLNHDFSVRQFGLVEDKSGVHDF